MVTSSQAYSIAYSEVGGSVDGWSTTKISSNGTPPTGLFSPSGPPTTWEISWFDADGSTLASAHVDAQTGAVSQ